MKVLLIHNYYQKSGGEDQVFSAESVILEACGHRVFRYTVHNDDIKKLNFLTLTKSTFWNKSVASELRILMRQVRPDVIHFHNTFPLISPAAYYAAKAERVPVVQTLHNYRLLCPNALFFRNNHICEACMGKFLPWPGILHGCYRSSRAATSVIAATLWVHRLLRTYNRMVDLYIALTDFARKKIIEGGIPAEKIVIKPNFLYPDPGNGNGCGGYALFVGRLAPEKGVNILLSAWDKMGCKIPIKIVGDGPLISQVAEVVKSIPKVECLGQKPRQFVLELMKDASVLIFPSICYEGLPMTIIDAYSVGLPVIASNLGSMSSLIDHRHTGLHFHPGDPGDLAAQVDWIISHPFELEQMRQEARAEFEAKYTVERNYEMLMEIYERAIACSR